MVVVCADVLTGGLGVGDGSHAISQPSSATATSTAEMLKLRREFESLARKLSAKDSEITGLQEQVADQTRVITRLTLALEDSSRGGEYSPSKSRLSDGGGSGGGSGGVADGPKPSSALVLKLQQQLAFYMERDMEAESVLGIVCSMLQEARQLCAVLQLRLNADVEPFALAEIVNYSSRKGVPPSGPSLTTRTKYIADLLDRFVRERSADGFDVDGVSDDAVVLDRHAIITALTACTQTTAEVRMKVADALSQQVGSECAMQ